jgi:hypothetical protein
MQDKELYEMLSELTARWSTQEVNLQVGEMKVKLKQTDYSFWSLLRL